MLTEERKEKILTLLSNQEIVKSQELISLLDASESTIRRDLKELEEAQLLKRIHGGAKRIIKLDREPNMIEKSSKNIQEKKNIGQEAASFVQVGDFIYLDAGTSTYEMIPHLANKDIHVVTNSVYHATLLTDLNIPTMIIGGTIKLSTKAVISAFSLNHLKQFRFDKAFMGINGIHSIYGYTTPDPEEATMKSVAMEQAEQVYILADATKFGKVSFTKVGDIQAAQIITDNCSNELKESLKKLTTIQEVQQ